MMADDTIIEVPSRLCTKDGRKYGNGFLHSSVRDGDITVYRVETDFGNQLSVSKDELLSFWWPMPGTWEKITYEEWLGVREARR